ncbi:MAG TPA: flagellar basal body rod protein FlgC [Acidisarcina sp.]|nr:flagellar basal body rod protein FlgC [Acidisarcina sp.]
MNLFGLMEVSGSAMKAERIRAEVVASNMANADTTRTADGGPYRRQHVVFAAAQPASFANELSGQSLTPGLSPMPSISMPTLSMSSNPMSVPMLSIAPSASQSVPGGVDVSAVISDPVATQRRFDPQHPDADKDGYVAYPDINPLTEMVDLMGATRAYGLNSSAVQATKGMITASLEILK